MKYLLLDILSIGDEAPLFTLTDADGANVSLSDYLGKKHILLCFNMAYE
jgi:peroxiredoxin